jgi:hypothetical protein
MQDKERQRDDGGNTHHRFARIYEPVTAEEQKEYFQTALDFVSERVGKQNVLSAVVHMDEKTPHMHLCFVPIT